MKKLNLPLVLLATIATTNPAWGMEAIIKHICTINKIESKQLLPKNIKDDLFEIARVASEIENKNVYKLCSKEWLNRVYGYKEPVIFFINEKMFVENKKKSTAYTVHGAQRSGYFTIKNPNFPQLNLIRTIYKKLKNNTRVDLNDNETKIFKTLQDQPYSLNNFLNNNDNGKHIFRTFVWSDFLEKKINPKNSGKTVPQKKTNDGWRFKWFSWITKLFYQTKN